MAYRDLREFLSVLEKEQELLTVTEPVDLKFEYCALLDELDYRRGPALHATNIPGSDASLVGNLLGTRRRLALGLETTEEAIGEEYIRRKAELIPPVLVSDGVAQEVIVDSHVDVGQSLPIPTFHERDASPYLTAGVAIARSPVTGFQSTGIHRAEIVGPDKLRINLATPPLSTFLAEAEERGETLPMAICVGIDPGMLFSSVVSVPGADRFAIAGAMRGEAVELVRGRTVPLTLPATAEVVIEGEVQPGVRELDGPFGETTGYYFRNRCAVITVTAITHRRHPMLHAVHPMCTEVFNMMGPAREAELRQHLRSLGMRVEQVHITPESCGLHVVVSMSKRARTEVRQVILQVLSFGPFTKQVTVVDDDVNPFDARDVAWAVATRSQPDRDIVIAGGMGGSSIDPSSVTEERAHSVTGKLGIDATRPDREPRFDRMRVPEPAQQKARSLLDAAKISA